MWVVGAFWHLMLIVVTWKSTSSCGWEYFDCVRGLGFESYVCYLCVVWVILILIWMIMLGDNIIIELEELTQMWLGWIGCALTLEL